MHRVVVGIVLLLSTAPGLAQAAPKDCSDWRSETERAHPEAVVPEPKAPSLECIVEREVKCVAPSPVRSAWQMTPFTQCPRTTPRWKDGVVEEMPGFSRKETRARRLKGKKDACAPTPDEGECCYVQFSATTCR